MAPPANVNPQPAEPVTNSESSQWDRPRQRTVWRPNLAAQDWSAESSNLLAAQFTHTDLYGLYLKMARTLRASPAFHLDYAEYFARSGQKRLAARILSNIPEMAADDERLLRVVAGRLELMGNLDQAIDLYERARGLDANDLQLCRDLALVLADRADARAAAKDFDGAHLDFERSLSLLHGVVMDTAPASNGIRAIALEDAGRIIARANAAIRLPQPEIHHPFDSRLTKLLDMDVRVVMTCPPGALVEMTVREPSSEECGIGHAKTTIGGLFTASSPAGTQEYGLRKKMLGRYEVKARLVSNSGEKTSGPALVRVVVYTNFGRSDEKREVMSVKLKSGEGEVEVGVLQVK